MTRRTEHTHRHNHQPLPAGLVFFRLSCCLSPFVSSSSPHLLLNLHNVAVTERWETFSHTKYAFMHLLNRISFFFCCEKPQRSCLSDALDIFFFFFNGPWGARQNTKTFCYITFAASLPLSETWYIYSEFELADLRLASYNNVPTIQAFVPVECNFPDVREERFLIQCLFNFLRILLGAPHRLDCWFQPGRFCSVVRNGRSDAGCSGPTTVYLIVDVSPLCKM